MANKNIVVVIDTNLWISFLIGKRSGNLISILSKPNITIAMSGQGIEELRIVVSRDKFRKYFPISYSKKLFAFLAKRTTMYNVVNSPQVCRDPKDDYLLALSDIAKADYLITGDKDLLDLHFYKDTKILHLDEFIKCES